jgi:hypothetical protein
MPDEMKLGATGKFPDGKLNAADEGEIRCMIGLNSANNVLVMDFGKAVSWLGLGKKQVLAMILLLQKWLAKMEAAEGKGTGRAASPGGLQDAEKAQDAASAEGESRKYPQGRGRDRMRDQCVGIYAMLYRKTPNRISISQMGRAFGVSTCTIRRWIDSFSKVLDIRVEHGFVIIGEG